MKNSVTIPHIPFYFLRHGETDWNKYQQALCSQDEVTLNETGLAQAINVRTTIDSLGITTIYASPLIRAKQTAEIVNEELNLNIKLHEGLRKIIDLEIAFTFAEILEPSHTTLIVSHGEVYRVLLRILGAETTEFNAKNCGVYFFRPPNQYSDQWAVSILNK